MKKSLLPALLAGILGLVLCAVPALAETQLEHWPADARAKLETMIARNANTGACATSTT
jgi:hypothetical protein